MCHFINYVSWKLHDDLTYTRLLTAKTYCSHMLGWRDGAVVSSAASSGFEYAGVFRGAVIGECIFTSFIKK